MSDKNCLVKLRRIFIVTLARYQLQFNTHPILYFAFYFFGAVHFWITVLYPKNQVTLIFRWLDISYDVYDFNPIILLYVMAAPVLIIVLWFMRQIYAAAKYDTLYMKTWQKYGMKIIGSLGILMTTAMMLTITRTFLEIIQPKNGYSRDDLIQSNSLKIQQLRNQISEFDFYFSWISLVLYSVVVFPLHIFFIVDLEPASQKVYSSLEYFNYMRAMPVIRYAFCLANILQKLADAGFVYSLFPVMLLLFVKYPVFKYNHDQFFRLLMYGMNYIMLIRSIANIYDKPILGGVIAVCSFLFVGFMFLISEMRIRYILQKQKSTTRGFKITIALLNDLNWNLKYLALYLLNHQKFCNDTQCLCQVVQMKEVCKPDKIQRWYEILHDFLERQYNLKEIAEMPKSKRITKIEKLQQIAIIHSSFMGKKLGKLIKALYILDSTKQQIDQLQMTGFYFRAYYIKFAHQMEVKMTYDTKQQNIVNKYAQNYMEYQLKIIKMNSSIRNSVKKHCILWDQLSKYQPDDQKVLKYIKESAAMNIQVTQCIKSLVSMSSEIISIIFPYYYPYYNYVCNLEVSKPKKQAIKIKRLSQDMNNYSYQSKTGTCMLKIMNTPQYGNIIHNNLYFEDFLGFKNNADKQKPLNMDQLVPQPFIKQHRRKQNAYIVSGVGYMIENVKVLIKKKSGHILDVLMTVQIHPSLQQGLVAEVFFFPKFSQNQDLIILCNTKGQLLNYSTTFERQILDEMEQEDLQKFNQFLRYTALRKLSLDNSIQQQLLFQFIQRKFILSLRRKFHDTQKDQQFYVIKIEEQKQQALLNTQPSKDKKINIQISKPQETSSLYQGSSQRLQNNKISIFGLINSKKFKENDIKLKLKSQRQKLQTNDQEDYKNKKEQQKLQKRFKIVSNNKTCKNVKCWSVGVILLIILILGLGFYTVALASQKILTVNKVIQTTERYQRINIFLEDALYHLRKANIVANQTQDQAKYSYHRNNFMKSKQNAVDMYSFLLEKERMPLMGYTSAQQGGSMNNNASQKIQIQLQDSDFFLTLQRYVFVGITNLAQGKMSQLAFPININQISAPFNNFKINFIQANLNSLLQVFPNFQQIKDNLFLKFKCQLGYSQCIINQKAYFVIPIMIGLTLFIFALSFFMSTKIKILKNTTLEMLQILPEDQLNWRKKMVMDYQKKQFPDQKKNKFQTIAKQHCQGQKILKFDKKYKNKTIKGLNQKFKIGQDSIYQHYGKTLRCGQQKSGQNQLIKQKLEQKNKTKLFLHEYNQKLKSNSVSLGQPSGMNSVQPLAMNGAGYSGLLSGANSLETSRILNENLVPLQSKRQKEQICSESSENQQVQNSRIEPHQILQNRFQENSSQIQQQKQNKTRGKKFKPVQFKKANHKITLIKYLILFIPFMIILISVIISFSIGTKMFVQHIHNRDLILQQKRVIKEIKLYTLELGLDDGTVLINQTKSISQNLNDMFQYAYQIERQLINRFIKANSSQAGTKISQQMNQINQHNICNKLEEMNVQGDQYTTINQDRCSNLYGKSFLTQGRRAALIGFLQDARLIWQNNTACQPCSPSHKLLFLQNETLSLMTQLDYYFSGITQYQIKLYQEELNQKQLKFSIQIFSQFGILFILTLITLIIFWIYFRRQMFQDITDIKSIFHVLSNETIKNNKVLKENVLVKVNYQFLK